MAEDPDLTNNPQFSALFTKKHCSVFFLNREIRTVKSEEASVTLVQTLIPVLSIAHGQHFIYDSSHKFERLIMWLFIQGWYFIFLCCL